MTPNQGTRLLYENDDLERVTSFEKKGYRTCPIFHVNGKRVPDDVASKARSNQTLLSFLRDVMLLTGSKLGCGEGGCGACTVMISKKDRNTDKIRHFSVNGCLMPVLAADGCHITTIEGIGTVKGDNLHPIQKAMTELHGSQCGFCTPGIVVSLYSLFANSCSMKDIEEHLDGNLCRCTGYRPIWDAAHACCDDAEDLVVGPCGTPCRECPERDTCEQDCNVKDKSREDKDKVVCSSTKDKVALKKKFEENNQDWPQQPERMFPQDLREPTAADYVEAAKPLVVIDQTEYQGSGTWFKPTTLEELLGLLKEFGDPKSGGCKLVVGNTEVGIETKFKNAVYPRLIHPSDTIEPLFQVSAYPDKILIGACAPLSDIQRQAGILSKNPVYERTVTPIRDMLRFFASTQIRNVACLGGNLVTASPISDMNPLLAATGAQLTLTSMGDDGTISRRSKPVDEFFLKYRTVDIARHEVLERVEVPILNKVFEYVKPFKQARRRDDDISIVTAGMRIRLVSRDNKFFIEHVAMAFGGMAPTTVMASETAKMMIGLEFTSETFVKAQDSLIQELSLSEQVPGGQAAYRMTLAASFVHKFFFAVATELKADVATIMADPKSFPLISIPLPSIPEISAEEDSAELNFLSKAKPSFSGTQAYPAPKVTSGLEDQILPSAQGVRKPDAASAVGKASVHQSGALHCTGEAVYVDDIPPPPGTLHGSLILASESGVILDSLDGEPALRVAGVVAVCTAEDVQSLGGKNWIGPVVKDENVFLPSGEVIKFVGQVIGIVVAETLESAEAGAAAVKIQYTPSIEKPIMTVEEAVAAGSFYEECRHKITCGDRELLDGLKDQADSKGGNVGDIVKVSGSFRSGAQEHFYLEPQTSLVVPSESDTVLTVYCATQAPAMTQKSCASVTGTPEAKVVCQVKRLGGGFGGKETRSTFACCAAAVAAKRTSRPVRLTLPRNVDMLATGHRHVFVTHYAASAQITPTGAKLVALDVKIYNNAGATLDVSGPVADRALFHIDGCYYYPNLRAEAVPCRTAQAPHTAFRGFGGPQGIAAAEHIVEHLALACNVPIDKFRRENMYKDGDSLHFGMILGSSGSTGKWNIPTMWDRLHSALDIPKRRAGIEEFNAKNKWVKRGCSILPTKFGVAFTVKYMNQGGALVHLYTDGTVLVSHGGTEMGQGLHTKVSQVAAQAFGIPVERVYVADSSTDKVANSMPTAASMSTDLYGMCTLNACRQILARLKPFRERYGPNASLAHLAAAASMERVDLSAHGFFAPDDARLGYDFDGPKPEGLGADVPENSWKGHPFNYFTQGVAYTEVEVDLLTGDHRTLFSDVIVDVGSSINPAIDIGQIEGAFVQGMGWCTLEEIVYSDDDHKWAGTRGSLFTAGPGAYKLPSFNDQPEVFNVSLLEDVDNPFVVHSSKAIGEPPFFLGGTVFFAIKDAIRSARKSFEGKDSYFEMRMPATTERIRLYANDGISLKAKRAMLGADDGASTYQPQGSF